MRLPAERSAPAAATAATVEDIAVGLDGVTKRFGATTALDDVSLLVRRGELMTLLGPSGCGKTTLLNLVAGFIAPDRGEIAIDGERVTDRPAYPNFLNSRLPTSILEGCRDVKASRINGALWQIVCSVDQVPFHLFGLE